MAGLDEESPRFYKESKEADKAVQPVSGRVPTVLKLEIWL